MQEPSNAGLLRIANAGPELPGTIGRLPNGEIDRLLLAAGELAEIRVRRNLPPTGLVDLRHSRPDDRLSGEGECVVASNDANDLTSCQVGATLRLILRPARMCRP